jgi:hypothetical protein
MMGRLKSEQGQLFYRFDLNDAVPEDHLVRMIGRRPRSDLASQRAGRHYAAPPLSRRAAAVARRQHRRRPLNIETATADDDDSDGANADDRHRPCSPASS